MMKDVSKSTMNKGQAILEFSFSIIVALMFLHILFVIFKWAGQDLSQRQALHESTLTTPVPDHWSSSQSPLRQLEDISIQQRNLELF